MRFLIVDDSERPLRYLADLLSRLGHEVAGIAHNGQEAVEMFNEINPDVVILDVIMPRLNGLDALEIIHRANPRTAVVMASSLRSSDTALECEKRGASYFLRKPFQESHLRQVIGRIQKGLKKSGEHSTSTGGGSLSPHRKSLS